MANLHYTSSLGLGNLLVAETKQDCSSSWYLSDAKKGFIILLELARVWPSVHDEVKNEWVWKWMRDRREVYDKRLKTVVEG